MNFSWITAFITVYYLPLQLVTAQFGIYNDNGIYKYYKSQECKLNNFYTQIDLTGQFTVEKNTDCCYALSSRNSCCELSTYDFVIHKFTTTCRCDPGATCTARNPTTRTTTTTTTTIPPTRPLFCPHFGARTQNSMVVSDRCGAFPGVFRVVRSGNPPVTICNAVLAAAYVSGFRTITLVTSEWCKRTASAPGINGGIAISPTTVLPGSKFNMISGRNGVAFFQPKTHMDLAELTSQCRKTACGLREDEMIGKIDYDNCQVLSYGSVTVSTPQTELRSIRVRISPLGCRNLPAPPYTTSTSSLCFTTTDQVPIICSSDFGAPVFCRSSVTDENIVVGIMEGTNTCGPATSFRVLYYPSF